MFGWVRILVLRLAQREREPCPHPAGHPREIGLGGDQDSDFGCTEASAQTERGKTYRYTARKWQMLPARTNRCQIACEYFQRRTKKATPNV